MYCNLRSAIYVVQSMLCNLCTAKYVGKLGTRSLGAYSLEAYVE